MKPEMTDPSPYDHERSLVADLNELRKGYSEDFVAERYGIRATRLDILYAAQDLTIDRSERFEGRSNPADSSELLAISAPNGVKGILISTYGAKHSQNEEQLRQLGRNDT